MIQYLRDSHLNTLGWIRDSGRVLYLYDKHGSTLGTYIKDTDITSDAHGRIVGRGNLLMMLINCSAQG